MQESRLKKINEDFQIRNFREPDYDIDDQVLTNKQLELFLNIGEYKEVEGDDIICMNTKTNEILLYLVQTGDMQFVHVANNFDEFYKMIKY